MRYEEWVNMEGSKANDREETNNLLRRIPLPDQ